MSLQFNLDSAVENLKSLVNANLTQPLHLCLGTFLLKPKITLELSYRQVLASTNVQTNGMRGLELLHLRKQAAPVKRLKVKRTEKAPED